MTQQLTTRPQGHLMTYTVVGAISCVWIVIVGVGVRVIIAARIATHRNGDTGEFAIVTIGVEQPVNLV